MSTRLKPGDAPPGAAGTPELSALVSARLCHDLVSPLGAIGNGLELIEMTGTGRVAAEIALISDSLGNALGKLKFLRLAFGSAEAGARHSLEEAAAISDAAFQGRFSIAWNANGHDIPRPLAQAIYLAILCLEKSLPLGGEVRVACEGAESALTVEGRRTAPPVEFWAHVLEGAPLPHVSADSVQFALLRNWLEATPGRMTAQFDGNAMALELALAGDG